MVHSLETLGRLNNAAVPAYEKIVFHQLFVNEHRYSIVTESGNTLRITDTSGRFSPPPVGYLKLDDQLNWCWVDCAIETIDSNAIIEHVHKHGAPVG